MRVGLIYLGRRGAGAWIALELAKNLQNRCSTLIVTSQYLEPRHAWETIPTEHIRIPTFHNSIQALLTLLFPTNINLLVQKIRIHRPDVLLFPMFHPWNAPIQKKLGEIPSVVFVHDPSPHPDFTSLIYNRLEQTSIRQAERYIIMSERLKGDLIKQGGAPNKIDIVPLGPFYSSAKRNFLPNAEKSPTLLFFGRIVSYKGLEILLQAYIKICQTHQARLVIAGEGNLRPIQKVLKTLPQVEVINHWIPEDKIDWLFSKSDLVLLPYTSASQSGIIPIAASFGLPVIATNTGGIPEQIQDGVSGWLVEPNDIDALSAAIRDALDHPDLAHQRGAALKRHYESQLNWENITSQVVDSLKRAAQARGQI